MQTKIQMATETKVPVTQTPGGSVLAGSVWRPFEALRTEIDRLFDELGNGFWRQPSRSLAAFERSWPKFDPAPAVDVAETDNSYEITAELPGIDEKNIEVNLANDGITIKGEKREETEEKRKDYSISERRYGSFERYFAVPGASTPTRSRRRSRTVFSSLRCRRPSRRRNLRRRSKSRQPEHPIQSARVEISATRAAHEILTKIWNRAQECHRGGA